ncbi:MAG TPA: STAS domain-containing protein [Solirubrobacteraceae bacterium]|nr:STAS domain-containing protein [Solirubrobacteraceae bacterium]
MIDKAAAPPVRARTLQLLELGRLTMSSEREGDVHTIGLTGELDLDNVAAVQHELDRAENGDALSIVVDLSRLTFIDSTGVRLVLAAHARAGADGGRLLLLRGPAQVQRVFEICGVDQLLPFAD